MSGTLVDLSEEDLAREALEAGDQYFRHLFGQELISSLAAHVRIGQLNNDWRQTGELQIGLPALDELRFSSLSLQAVNSLADLYQHVVLPPNTSQSQAHLFDEHHAGGVIYLHNTSMPIICGVSARCPGSFCVGAATVVAVTYHALWMEKFRPTKCG